MGFAPAEVDAMSLWEFQAVRNGYEDANTPEDEKGLSRSEFAELAEMIPVGGMQ